MTADFYCVTVEIDHSFDAPTADWIVDALADWHAVASGRAAGTSFATMTLPAAGIADAVATAVRAVESTHRVISVEAIDETTRDARLLTDH
ncbi:MAG: hypothetical protein Q4G67_14070 [Actinomycetia bacterium]|nr:hypothetical protein [Actinomycetes bacterium]